MDYIVLHVREIRSRIPNDRVKKEMLETHLVSDLVRWLPLHVDTEEKFAEVELRDILYLPQIHYPGHLRPKGVQQQVLTIAGKVDISRYNILTLTFTILGQTGPLVRP